ncbi:MAG TPA: putative toxin-antitoxin system toxin component, PIN family [Ignavibacteria bacterium]|nr:putative toxin-antitoxin system toxin component, PIN family [Ignavibacteria bacterium]
MKKKRPKVVIDTNVFISSLKSKMGVSYKLLFEVSKRKFEQNISPALIFEYESVAKRSSIGIELNDSQINSIIDNICKQSTKCQIFFLWRPFLKDPKDDLVLELAIESQSEFIITYNLNDFKGIEKFGIKVLTPKVFLELIGEL